MIINYLKSIFRKKEIINKDEILQINHKINSLRNDITLIKLNNNQILQMLKKINEKINKNGI